MLNIKPEIWTRNGGKRYVMLSFEDFQKVQELIEDAGLSRILREARRKEANATTLSLDEVKRQLGMKDHRRRRVKSA